MGDGPGPIGALFVYGTLMPGHLRWSMLAAHATRWRPAELVGELWDTRRGWPAARFATGAGVVPGWWVRFEPVVLGRLLSELDEMEGVSDPPDPAVDPYRRLIVAHPDHGRAWAYDALRIEPGWRRIEAWTDQPEA